MKTYSPNRLLFAMLLKNRQRRINISELMHDIGKKKIPKQDTQNENSSKNEYWDTNSQG